MYDKIPGKELVKQFMKRLFTNGTIRTFINTLIPITTSVYSSSYEKGITTNWYIPIVVQIIVIVIYNIIAEILIGTERKNAEYINLLCECYQNQCKINKRSATKLFRLNKLITTHLQSNKPVDKIVFDKVADFNTVAFDICSGIYKMLEDKFGKDINCEVTVYQAKGKDISMIAYANQDDAPPLSYRRVYKMNSKNKNEYLFLKLFNDLNAQIHCCINKKEIEEDFTFLEGSEVREKEICQYIGIPLKTARKKIELLLQIDVSKPNIFGKKKRNVRKLAKEIFYPYVVLLNKAYERDLIFDGYYDIIVEKLSIRESEAVK